VLTCTHHTYCPRDCVHVQLSVLTFAMGIASGIYLSLLPIQVGLNQGMSGPLFTYGLANQRCARTHTSIRTHLCSLVCRHADAHVRAFICAHTFIHTRTCMHACIHIQARLHDQRGLHTPSWVCQQPRPSRQADGASVLHVCSNGMRTCSKRLHTCPGGASVLRTCSDMLDCTPAPAEPVCCTHALMYWTAHLL